MYEETPLGEFGTIASIPSMRMAKSAICGISGTTFAKALKAQVPTELELALTT